jgi:hypothetical protein
MVLLRTVLLTLSGLITLSGASLARADSVIINAGNCNVNINGTNNSVTQSGNCSNFDIHLINQKAADGQPDVCIEQKDRSVPAKCSLLITGHHTVYGLNNSGPFVITGRYTGEFQNGVPHGRGQFSVTHLVTDPSLLFNLFGNLPDLFHQLEQGRKLFMDGRWVNGYLTCHGRIIMPQGGIMEGLFQNGILVDGNATSIQRHSIGLTYYFPEGCCYAGTVKNGIIKDGAITEVIKEDNGEEYTAIKEGEFAEERIVNGTSALRDIFRVSFRETIRDDKVVSTYKR